MLISAQFSNQSFLLDHIIMNQQLCSVNFVQINESHHDEIYIKMLLEFVSNDHKTGIVESVLSKHLFGDVNQDFWSDKSR